MSHCGFNFLFPYYFWVYDIFIGLSFVSGYLFFIDLSVLIFLWYINEPFIMCSRYSTVWFVFLSSN